MLVEERLAGDDEAGRTEPALLGVVLDEGRLDRSKLPVGREPFDRRDLLPLRLEGEHRAGVDGLAPDDHGAGPAGGAVAHLLGSREVEVVAQRVEQGHARLDLDLLGRAIDPQRDWDLAGAEDLHIGRGLGRGAPGHERSRKGQPGPAEEVATREAPFGLFLGIAGSCHGCLPP